MQVKNVEHLEVNNEWLKAIAAVENGEHVYITGGAGTGKSTLLRHLLSLTNKPYAVVAPTGVAALNVRGQTIHSLFKFPARYIDAKLVKGSANGLWKHLKMLVIDEVSMVRADLMDGIDVYLRKSRDNDAPFGGVQIVMVGDLYQLPPVVDSDELHIHLLSHYGGPYFFQSDVFSRFRPTRITLLKNYRQNETEFLRLLWKVRTGMADQADLAALNQRFVRISEHDESYIQLTSTNLAARKVNSRFLDSLQTELFTYPARIRGQFSRSVNPADELLQLKVGAKIMMVKNDRFGRWVNGSTGRVAALKDDSISVAIGEAVHCVDREEWEQIRYVCHEGRILQDVVGVFEQFPIRLAWAITIHKSQGHTLHKVCIDLGNSAFAHGQTYVALSRCTTLNGIVLRRPIRRHDIIVDPMVVDYENKSNREDKVLGGAA